jgi:hypothetical protein
MYFLNQVIHMIFEILNLRTNSPQFPWRSKYNHTKQIFVNSYPWLFPSGVGDIYDLEQGEIPIKEWGQHLL